MSVFENCSVLLELKNVPFKEKKKLKSAVTENGGNLSFVVNKQCTLIVTSDLSHLSASRLRGVQKNHTPVVSLEYVQSCVERGVLLPVDEYRLDVPPASAPSPPPPLSQPVYKVPRSKEAAENKSPTQPVELARRSENSETTREKSKGLLETHRTYTETDPDFPHFPEDFHVAVYSIFEKVNSTAWCVLELQSSKGEGGCRYRVVRYWKEDLSSKKAAVRDKLVFLSTSEDALEVYKILRDELRKNGLQLKTNVPLESQGLGSEPLQQLLLEEKLNTGALSKDVALFVELFWAEALGCLDNILSISVDKISLNDVSRVEGLLLQAQKMLKEENHGEVLSLIDEVYLLLPHKEPPTPPSAKFLSQKLDLCQLIQDIVNVSEMTLRSPAPSSLGKYRALRCSIDKVPMSSSEFQLVAAPLRSRLVEVKQVLRVSRGAELQAFNSELGNIKPLLHSTSTSNFVGVLSRGLLLPRVGVEQHGIQRTDVGNLGSGIYFSDNINACLKYSKPSETDGCRLLLVCDVALGQCKDVVSKDYTLTEAPQGFHSVRGVRASRNNSSDFEDNEYVVYSPDQVRLKYVVQFVSLQEKQKDFSPGMNISAEPLGPCPVQELLPEDEGLNGVQNPLDDMSAGLLDSVGKRLPLQAVHVRGKLMDLLSQVTIFQQYTNESSVAIEAKYVFPLDDSAAVCGFEAFINGKHVVGKVKEKEAARKEYKQAIEKGHGAYLMDQDAPDVFTISVGNLPPGATVLIKVTFVSELIIRDGSVVFSLPGSVAPWQESAALHQTTQVTVEKVCVTDEDAGRRVFSLEVSVEMPNRITGLECLTHRVQTKRTDCKAVVSVLPGQVMTPEGFQLCVGLSDVHLPRMWVEQHPAEDSQACMLVFYPDFEVKSSSSADEVVLLLDTSESMKGDSLRTAQRIALQVLKQLDQKLRVNVILFGTDHKSAFLAAQPLAECRGEAERFLKCFSPVGGSTELWRPLRALGLLPPSHGVRNLLLLSDGHAHNAETALKLLRDSAPHSRLFTCGLSPTANRHMLRALAQAGGGAYEFFDTKTKHTWAGKVAAQVKRMSSPGCSSVSVKWQQFNPTAPPPLQAPGQLHALFNACPTLVFGFVQHCTQATLFGNLSGEELETMVSTSELQKTKGTFLHKLTARALIRDYEDGSLHANAAEHERKKAALKAGVIEMSKAFSILSQFTSFVAIEERESGEADSGFTDIPKLIKEEDVDLLPYMGWTSAQSQEVDKGEDESTSEDGSTSEDEEEDEDMGFGLFESCDMDLVFGTVKNVDREVFLYEDADDSPGHEPTDLVLGTVENVDAERLYGSFGGHEPTDMGFGTVENVDHSEDVGDSPENEPTSPSIISSSSSDMDVSSPPPLPRLDSVTSRSFHRSSFKKFSRSFLSFGDQAGTRKAPPSSSLSFGGQAGTRKAPPSSSLSFGALADTGNAPPSSSLSFGALADTGSTPPSSSSFCVQADTWKAPPSSSLSFGVQADTGNAPPSSSLSFGALADTGSTPPSSSLSFCVQADTWKAPPSSSLSFGVQADTGSAPSSSSLSFGVQADTWKAPPSSSLSFGALADTGSAPPSSSLSFLQANTWSAPQSSGALFGSVLEKSALPPVTPLNVSLMSSHHKSFRSFSELQPASFQAQSFDAPPPPPPASSSFSGFQARSFCAPPPPPPASSFSGFQARSFCPPPPPPPASSSFSGFKARLFGAPPPPPPASSSSFSGFQARSFGAPPPPPPASSSFSGFQTQSFCPPPPPPPASSSVSGFQALSFDAPLRPRMGRNLTGRTRWDQSMLRTLDEEFSSLKAKPRPVEKKCRLAVETLKSFCADGSREEARELNWTEIFQLQHPEGYWEITTKFGELINLNVDFFANEFLKNKGIGSLGVKAHTNILKLLATLLVLQLMRLQKLEEGKLLRTLFCLDDPSQSRPSRWEQVKKAVAWACWADREYPCIYSRLEFGYSWESSTRQLLGYEVLPSFSPLRAVLLQGSAGHRVIVA